MFLRNFSNCTGLYIQVCVQGDSMKDYSDGPLLHNEQGILRNCKDDALRHGGSFHNSQAPDPNP